MFHWKYHYQISCKVLKCLFVYILIAYISYAFFSEFAAKFRKKYNPPKPIAKKQNKNNSVLVFLKGEKMNEANENDYTCIAISCFSLKIQGLVTEKL